MQRVELAVSHIRDTLVQAHDSGGLKWFNRAFHDFRLLAKACGHPPMTCAQARARLRRVIVRRLLLGQHSGFGAEILPEIFDKAPPQHNRARSLRGTG
jgi:hypothetical protein